MELSNDNASDDSESYVVSDDPSLNEASQDLRDLMNFSSNTTKWVCFTLTTRE